MICFGQMDFYKLEQYGTSIQGILNRHISFIKDLFGRFFSLLSKQFSCIINLVILNQSIVICKGKYLQPRWGLYSGKDF